MPIYDPKAPDNVEYRARLHEALNELLIANLEKLAEGQRKGAITEDERAGVLTAGLLRGLDRIADLPEDEELNPDQVSLFQSGLVQIIINGLALCEELPFPPNALTVVAFDTGNVQ